MANPTRGCQRQCGHVFLSVSWRHHTPPHGVVNRKIGVDKRKHAAHGVGVINGRHDMNTTKSIPAISDPVQAAAAIMEHVAAIDALLNGIKWHSVRAEDIAQDVSVAMTEAMDVLGDALKDQDEWHAERGE
jgi:hypothetical protein